MKKRRRINSLTFNINIVSPLGTQIQSGGSSGTPLTSSNILFQSPQDIVSMSFDSGLEVSAGGGGAINVAQFGSAHIRFLDASGNVIGNFIQAGAQAENGSGLTLGNKTAFRIRNVSSIQIVRLAAWFPQNLTAGNETLFNFTVNSISSF